MLAQYITARLDQQFHFTSVVRYEIELCHLLFGVARVVQLLRHTKLAQRLLISHDRWPELIIHDTVCEVHTFALNVRTKYMSFTLQQVQMTLTIKS